MLKLAISKSSCDLFQIKPDNNLINHFSVVVKWLRLAQKNDSKKIVQMTSCYKIYCRFEIFGAGNIMKRI